MSAAVVDTNVLIVANGKNTHATGECQLACIRRLRVLREHGIVVLDEQDLIFDEYKNQHLKFSGQPGVGDAFFRHLHEKKHDAAKVELVTLTPIGNGNAQFREFPANRRLARFDRSDRKFVAAAKASVNNPKILNATDSDWEEFQTALQANGVIVDQLCPEHAKKQ